MIFRKMKLNVVKAVIILIQIFITNILISQEIETVISEGHRFQIIVAESDIDRNLIATFDRSKKLIIWDIKNAAKLGSCNLNNRLSEYEYVINIDIHPVDYRCLITTPNRSFEFDIETNILKELFVANNSMLAGYYSENQYWYGMSDGMFSWNPDSLKLIRLKEFTTNKFYKSGYDIYYSSFSKDVLSLVGVSNDERYSVKIDSTIEIYDLYFDSRNKLIAYYSAPRDVSPKNFEFSFHLLDMEQKLELKTKVNQEDPDGFAISQSGKYLVFADSDSAYSLVDPNVLRIFDIEGFKEKEPLKVKNDNMIRYTPYLVFLNSDREILFSNYNELYRFDISSESLINQFPVLDSKIDDALISKDNVFFTTSGSSNVFLTKFSLGNMQSQYKTYNGVNLSSINYYDRNNLLLVYMGDYLDYYNPDSLKKIKTTIFYPKKGIDWRFLRSFNSEHYDTSLVVLENLEPFNKPEYSYVNIDFYKRVPNLATSRYEYLHEISDSTFIGVSDGSIGYFSNSEEVPLVYCYLDEGCDTIIIDSQLNEYGDICYKSLYGRMVDTSFDNQQSNTRLLWDGTNVLNMITIIYDTVIVSDNDISQTVEDIYAIKDSSSQYRKFIDYANPVKVVIDRLLLKPKVFNSLNSFFKGSPMFLEMISNGTKASIVFDDNKEVNFRFSGKSIIKQEILTKKSEYESFQLDLGDSLIMGKEIWVSFENSLYDDINYGFDNSEKEYTQLYARNKYDIENEQFIPIAPSFEKSPTVFQLNDTLLLLHLIDGQGDSFELYEWNKDSLWMNYLDWFRYSINNTWNFSDINNVHLSQNNIIVSGKREVIIPFMYKFEVPQTTILNIDNPRPSNDYDESKLKIIEQNNLLGQWQLKKNEDVNNSYYFDLINKLDADKKIRFYVFQNKDWIIQDNSKYYMGTKGAFEFIKFRDGFKLFEFEQFDLKFNRPDIILESLGFADDQLIEVYKKAYEKRLKKMGFNENMLNDDFHLPEIQIENYKLLPSIIDDDMVKLYLNLKDSIYKLDRVNVWLNDVPIYGIAGISIRNENTQEYQLGLEIDLVAGKNKIQVAVMNQSGAESYKETYFVTSTKRIEDRSLYIAAISVSDYLQSDYNLKYAVKDSRDLVNLYSENASATYDNLYIDTLFNSDVTLENVKTLKQKLLNSDVNDQVILYVSGHGLLDDNLDFYFASHNMDFNDPAKYGISYDLLEDLLDSIPARKKLFLMDACHSGEVDKDELIVSNENNNESGIKSGVKSYSYRGAKATTSKKDSDKLGLQNSFELMQELFTNLNRGSGAMVISAAAGDSYALESNEWNNGVFTYALINGLKNNAADANGNGEVSVSELRSYVIEQVQELTGGKQKPTSRQENVEFDFRVW